MIDNIIAGLIVFGIGFLISILVVPEFVCGLLQVFLFPFWVVWYFVSGEYKKDKLTIFPTGNYANGWEYIEKNKK